MTPRKLSVLHDNNKVLLADAGAIPAVVALLGPQSSAGIQEHAVRAIANLVVIDDNKVKIMAAGGVEALSALEVSPLASVTVNRWVKMTLGYLSA